MARRDISINSKGFILVFVSPYCNKQCQLERAHDLVMSFQRQQSDFADCQQKDLCLSVSSVGKVYSHADFADFADNNK